MPIQILIGTESPLIEKEISRIKESVLQGGLSDFNFDSFSIREHAVETILAAANLFPMMGEKRLVLVRDISEIKAKDMEAWSAYFSNPSPTTCLLMVGEKIDKRLKAWQVANKAGFIRELKAPTGVQLTSWLVREAQERGLSLSAQAAHLMTETLGDSLGSLLQALEKIALLITPRKEISLEDIRSVVGRFLSEDVFHWVDLVFTKKRAEALHLLQDLLTLGEQPVKLLSLISRHNRILLKAQANLSLPENELAKILGVHPFFLKDYVRQARSIPSQKTKALHRTLLKTDRLLKSSPVSPSHHLENLLLEMT